MRELTTGGQKWVRALKANVVPATPSGSFSANTVSTYQSSASQTFTWNLGSDADAPIIGNIDTTAGSSPSQNEILYRENKSIATQSWRDGKNMVLIDAGIKACTAASQAVWTWSDNSAALPAC